jgi:WD repeat-containing protein 91
MSHVQYMDEMVKEYLLFRGFCTTLKTFDAELKTDKDKGFRVSLIQKLIYLIFLVKS